MELFANLFCANMAIRPLELRNPDAAVTQRTREPRPRRRFSISHAVVAPHTDLSKV